MGCLTSNLPRLVKLALIAGATASALTMCRASLAGHGEGGGGHGEAAASAHSNAEGGGIELGEYKIRSDYPAEAQKSTVRFVLYAAVKSEAYSQMSKIAEEHQQKVRDEVITATRLTPLSTFEEPDLATFRRRILVRLRRTLPELAIEELYISDFSLMVKSL